MQTQITQSMYSIQYDFLSGCLSHTALFSSTDFRDGPELFHSQADLSSLIHRRRSDQRKMLFIGMLIKTLHSQPSNINNRTYFSGENSPVGLGAHGGAHSFQDGVGNSQTQTDLLFAFPGRLGTHGHLSAIKSIGSKLPSNCTNLIEFPLNLKG